MTGPEWKRLAQLVVSRRVQLGMKTTKALAEAADLTPRAVGDIENARRTNYSPGTRAQIENALRWTPGSFNSALAGGEPTPLAADAEEFVSRLRHPSNARQVAEAVEGGDPVLIDVLEQVLADGQLPPSAQAALAKLVDETAIRQHPQLFESLSRPGKLKVAHYGQEIYREELGGSDELETETSSGTSVQAGSAKEVSAHDAERGTLGDHLFGPRVDDAVKKGDDGRDVADGQ